MKVMEKDERFIFLIGQARHRLFIQLDKALMATAGVTAAQSGALYYLMDNDGCLLSRLSRALMLDKSAITGLVDRLEKKGLVLRHATPTDRRAINIRLSEEGRGAAKKCLQVTRKFNDAIIEGLSQEEIDGFSRILRTIISRFSQQP